ncbi:hypothetical protein H0H93_010758, partial [Arthromyces matolae]
MNLTFVTTFISTFLFLLATSSPIPPQTHLQPSNDPLSFPYDASNDFLDDPSSDSDCQAAAGYFPKTSPDNEDKEQTVIIAIPPSFRGVYPKSHYEVKVKPKMTAKELEPIVEILKPAWTAALQHKDGELNRVLREFECRVRKNEIPIADRKKVTSDAPIGVINGVVMIQTPPLPKVTEIPFGRQEIDIPLSLQGFCGKKPLVFTSRQIMTEEDLKPVREVLALMWAAVKKERSSDLRDEVQNFETRLRRRHVPLASRGVQMPQPSRAGIIQPPRLALHRKTRGPRAGRSKNPSVVQPPQPLSPPLDTTPLRKTTDTEPPFQPHTPDHNHWQHTQSGNIAHGYYQHGPAGDAGGRTGFNLGLPVAHTDSPESRLAQLGGLPSPQSYDYAQYDPQWNYEQDDYGWESLKTPPHLPEHSPSVAQGDHALFT